MFTRTPRRASLLLAAVCAALPTRVGAAEQLERVEITGSAIRRIASEGALPVTTLTRTDIEKSGATSVAELIQKLPAMQGFTTSSQSVNGGGAGTTTASLHALGSNYTLVLLNGRRMAPFNTGSTVNLESIPLSAVERVEVLLDGASALYGSDAIGGVVNFILRRNSTAGEAAVSANVVERGGGEIASAAVTKGFGDLDRDGYNVLASLSVERQSQLKASQRAFSRSGIIRGIDGQNVGMRLFSSSSAPGNVTLKNAANTAALAFYSPHLLANGTCPDLHVVNGRDCRFDFASQVDLIPESQRATGLLSGRLKVGGGHELFSDLVLSRFSNKPTFAPPAQVGLRLTPALFDRHVRPHLGTLGLTEAQIGTLTDADPQNDPTYNIRVFDAGGRRDEYTFDTQHWVLGSEGAAGAWDYKTALTLSRQEWTDKAIGGYLSANRYDALIASDAYDPLGMAPGQGRAALAPAVLNEQIDRNLSTYYAIGASASRSLFKLAAGDVSLAVGAELASQGFRNDPAPILRGGDDAIIGASGGVLPFDTTRRSYGVFSEVLVPVTRDLEMTGSLRFDHYAAAVNRRRFDVDENPLPGSQEEGRASSSATWKLGARYQPVRELLLRGSVGTGFKAPSLTNITSPQQAFGVTTGSYNCPFVAPDPLAAGCEVPDSQYNMRQGGNASTGADALRPEKSTQFTLGFVVEPSADTSFGMDLWRVKLKDQISAIPEAAAFADPVTFRRLFMLAPDPITGIQRLNFIGQPVNLTESRYAGVDLNATMRANVAAGRVTATLAGTYMLEADYAVPGLPGYQSSLGRFGVDNAVVFRWKLAGSLTLDSGPWSTTLVGNYRSGYLDHVARCADPTLSAAECTAQGQWLGPEIRTVDPATGAFGARIAYARKVASYVTLDLQTKYSVNKDLDVTLGIRNVLGEDPPFSMQDAGGGNMRGFDGRYADPLGRTWTLKASYRF